MALITPSEHTMIGSRSFADAQSKFSEYTWDRRETASFADPFAQPERENPNPLPAATANDLDCGPDSRQAGPSHRGSVDTDPPSPTRRPSLPRYRSSPDFYSQEPSGLNILLTTSGQPAAPLHDADAASSKSPHDGTGRNSGDSCSPVNIRGSVVPMSRSVEHTEGTLANLLPRLSFAPLALRAPRRSSVQGFDAFTIRDSASRQSASSHRGSWAQINALHFPPPVTTLGREFRSRFNSVDSAFQRSSDAGSLFGSLEGNDWLKPTGLQGHEWRSSDWSTSSVRRGSDPHSRRRSSLARTAHINLSMSRPASISFASASRSKPGFESGSCAQSHRESTHSRPLRDFQFGVSNLWKDLPSDRNTVQEQEEFVSTDWHTRRGSWAEV